MSRTEHTFTHTQRRMVTSILREESIPRSLSTWQRRGREPNICSIINYLLQSSHKPNKLLKESNIVMIAKKNLYFLIINIFGGGRETAKWLRALVDLVEDFSFGSQWTRTPIPRYLKSFSASISIREIHGVYTHEDIHKYTQNNSK